tara:strand:+ start:128 stop:508 length:381 start_codon:yes stop_codon:yes gene_type:complete
MPQISVYLPTPLNMSLQSGDLVYYATNTNTTGGFDIAQGMIYIGPLMSISFTDTNGDGINDSATLLIDMPNGTTEPPPGSFILFAKNRVANESGMKGYYMETKFVNTLTSKAELFSVGCEISESSK